MTLFKKVVITAILVSSIILDGQISYSQYIEYGEYHYKVDKPPLKKFITYDYKNIASVVDSNLLSDRYTKEVILVDRKSYYIVLDFLDTHKPHYPDSVNVNMYQYIKMHDENELNNVYKFTLKSYKLYLKDFFEYLEQSSCVSEEDKSKIISRLKYW